MKKRGFAKRTMMSMCSAIAALAMSMGLSTVSSACYYWFAQPKMPDDIKKFRK